MDQNTTQPKKTNILKKTPEWVKRILPPFNIFTLFFILMIIWPVLLGIYFLGYSAYRGIDPTRFPEVSAPLAAEMQAVGPDAAPAQKGALLMHSVYARLQEELDSPFGWSINDLLISPTSWMDNRDNRQRGVLFATRMLLNFYSINFAKLGSADPENPGLKEVREKRLVYGEDTWGFFRPSAENEYEKAIKLMRQYQQALTENKAVYNMRTDSIYNVLKFISGEQLLGHPLGLLVQSNDDVGFFELDDRIYYTQGVVLVVRDLLHTLAHLYPEIREKGGAENLDVAFKEMDRICSFDPLIVLRGDRDSMLADHRGKMARYLLTVIKRIEDVQESMRR